MSHCVYILINPSLPNLLKIGFTTRSAEERAAELSVGTNMPTPFYVAYDEIVPDGLQAEVLIHTKLSALGCRITNKREFFSIPLKEAIKVVSLVAIELRKAKEIDDVGRKDIETDGIDGLFSSEDERPLHETHFNKAIDFYYGDDDKYIFQNFEAARLEFETAAAFGSSEAYYYLGNIYRDGEGVRRSFLQAIKNYEKGIAFKDKRCHWSLWTIYLNENEELPQHSRNSELSFKRILESHSPDEISLPTLSTYLMVSRFMTERMQGKTKKFSCDELEGKWVREVLDIYIQRCQIFFQEIKKIIANPDYSPNSKRSYLFPNLQDLLSFKKDTQECISDWSAEVKLAMAGVTGSELNFAINTDKEISAQEDPQKMLIRFRALLDPALKSI